MHRFDEDGLLDRMAERGALTPELMAALGARIARLPRRPRADSHGFCRPDDYRHSVAADIRQLREQGDRLDPPTSEALAEAMPGALEPYRRPGGAPRRGRRGAALPWRSALAQHRADRRQAGAVRRHRVLGANRQHRRALRSRLRPDGPLRARAAAAGQPTVERMAVAHRRAARGPHEEALALLPHVPVAPRRRSAPSSMLERPRWAARPTTAAPRLPARGARLPAAGAAAAAGDRRPVGQRQDHTGAEAARPEIGRAPGAVVVRSDVERKRQAGVALEDAHAGRQLHAGRLGQRSMPPSWPAPSACCGPGTASCSMRCSPARTSAPRPRRSPPRSAVPFEGIWLDVPKEVAQARVAAARPTPRTPRPPWSSASSATTWGRSPGGGLSTVRPMK